MQPACLPAGKYDSQIADFAKFMEEELGLSPATIRQRCSTVRQFLDQHCASDRPLNALTVSDVDAALAHMVNKQEYARVTVRTVAASLRAFFRYAQTQGWCSHGLASSIMAPRAFSQESLPYSPSWDQVRDLLAGELGDRSSEIRNHAILLLLAVYGLRAGEVSRLLLEDIDWEGETVIFRRSKRQGVHSYPLSRTVGDAIIRYLKDVRPRSDHREVFLTLCAPIQPIRGQTLWHLVAKRLRTVAPDIKHHGPHALRHACATRLINEGLSLKEVGDHLGHRVPDTTRIYSKVDLPHLREVAGFDLGGLL
jgi:site-specific recombinase XerD